ncbi:hypothetical protein Tco_1175742 [Tanacetum coccineum]
MQWGGKEWVGGCGGLGCLFDGGEGGVVFCGGYEWGWLVVVLVVAGVLIVEGVGLVEGQCLLRDAVLGVAVMMVGVVWGGWRVAWVVDGGGWVEVSVFEDFDGGLADG